MLTIVISELFALLVLHLRYLRLSWPLNKGDIWNNASVGDVEFNEHIGGII